MPHPLVLGLIGWMVMVTILLLWILFKSYGFTIRLDRRDDEEKIIYTPSAFGPGPGAFQIPDNEHGRRFMEKMALDMRPGPMGDGKPSPQASPGNYV